MAAISPAPAAPAAPTNPPYPQTAVVDTTIALVALIVNVFVPGIGTIIGGVIGEKPHIGRGIAQFLLSIIIVGWIWGIVTGVQMLTNARWKERAQGTPSV